MLAAVQSSPRRNSEFNLLLQEHNVQPSGQNIMYREYSTGHGNELYMYSTRTGLEGLKLCNEPVFAALRAYTMAKHAKFTQTGPFSGSRESF